MANDGLVDERLAKDFAQVSPFEAFLRDEADLACGKVAHDQSLVVKAGGEVSCGLRGGGETLLGENDGEALVDLAQGVLDGDLDVVERNVWRNDLSACEYG